MAQWILYMSLLCCFTDLPTECTPQTLKTNYIKIRMGKAHQSTRHGFHAPGVGNHFRYQILEKYSDIPPFKHKLHLSHRQWRHNSRNFKQINMTTYSTWRTYFMKEASSHTQSYRRHTSGTLNSPRQLLKNEPYFQISNTCFFDTKAFTITPVCLMFESKESSERLHIPGAGCFLHFIRGLQAGMQDVLPWLYSQLRRRKGDCWTSTNSWRWTYSWTRSKMT